MEQNTPTLYIFLCSCLLDQHQHQRWICWAVCVVLLASSLWPLSLLLAGWACIHTLRYVPGTIGPGCSATWYLTACWGDEGWRAASWATGSSWSPLLTRWHRIMEVRDPGLSKRRHRAGAGPWVHAVCTSLLTAVRSMYMYSMYHVPRTVPRYHVQEYIRTRAYPSSSSCIGCRLAPLRQASGPKVVLRLPSALPPRDGLWPVCNAVCNPTCTGQLAPQLASQLAPRAPMLRDVTQILMLQR